SARKAITRLPDDWDKQVDAQLALANVVTNAVCRPSYSDTDNTALPNRKEIVAQMITNALYYKRGDPACTDATKENTCPPEQPKEYRNAMANRLQMCAASALGADDVDNLRSGKKR